MKNEELKNIFIEEIAKIILHLFQTHFLDINQSFIFFFPI